MINLSAILYINNNKIELNQSNIFSLEGEIMSRSDEANPSWGIISNGGSATFNDNYKTFLYFAENNLLQDGSKIEIYINNTLSKAKKLAGTFYTENWDYDNDNRSVSVSFKDSLKEWQNIYFSGLEYSDSKTMSLYEIYTFLKGKSKIRDIVFEEINQNSKFYDFLTNTICNYPYLESGNLWNAWEKFCNACSCYIFIGINGKVVVHYEFED